MTKSEIAAWLLRHDGYLILTHRRPDGDTVGSAVALCLGLRSLGKRAELFPNPQFPEKFLPLIRPLTGKGDPEGKTLLTVDTATRGMLPYNAQHLAERIELAIDHHSSHTPYAAHTFVEGTAAACGEIVGDLLTEMGVRWDRTVADALYVAVSTDTGCFRFGNTTAATLRTAAACLECGADAETWNRELFLTRSAARLRVEAHITQTAEFFLDGKICLCQLPYSVLKACGAREDDLDEISGFPRSIQGVEVGVMLRESLDGAKISLRTYKPWDASAVCGLLGGGGHTAAAGATVKGDLAAGREAILAALRQYGKEVGLWPAES